jgi:solute:Na+ symporter, SSS family
MRGTVFVVIAVAVARREMGQGVVEFFLGGRKIRGFVSGMTYAATTYSAFMLVGLAGLTYRSGVGALGFEMTYLMFTVIFKLLGKRYDHRNVSLAAAIWAGMRSVSWTDAVQALVMIITSVIAILFVAFQFFGVLEQELTAEGFRLG